VRRRIATHRGADPDAVVSAWLAERFVFAGEPCEVVFVSRKPPKNGYPDDLDCLTDVGNEHDPARRRFDHKPPAFSDRNAHCAASLVWDHLCASGADGAHLAPLVRAVHQGDRNPPGRPGPDLIESRASGFHAHFRRVHPRCGGSDATLYAVMRLWLDYHYGSPHRKG